MLCSLDVAVFGQVMQSLAQAHATGISFARRFLAGINRYGRIYDDLIEPAELLDLVRDDDCSERSKSN
eukprot:12925388-Prorocentrum_lima.AAC.1